ncbi:sigma-70 family RNA polymerase sigma factor [Formosa sp. PL04]|uniref:RNA polymerase sigma factor n=1 Tax=Formosa sp. PL04 TaxID=3081755 RepID=UPI00298221B5|nr:sigma-70 family RNA polymerase sigma factor [Formosa sp. PL04]MDW5290888.1 sigma-70 family RNA polymerase sigma factor [Formosa sp. PL04]
MENTIRFYEQREFHVFVSEAFPELIQLRKTGDQEAFNKLILKILPSIRKYINGRLLTAINKGHFSKNKYKANDFIDQLFIEVYNHIDDVKNAEYFYLWLFKKTDKLLEDVIVEEEFDDYFFKNIDDYSKPEWDEMEEKFSTDGGGDLLMIDELDDMSYNKNDYILNKVFIEDDEQKYITAIDKALKKDEAQKHTEMVLRKLPLKVQSVFDLFSNYNFSIVEIAKIKMISSKDVDQLMQYARKNIRASFMNRYLIDNK